MAVIDDLKTAYANVAANLAKITADPKPDYSIDGKTYSWAQLFRTYTDQMKVLKTRIQDEESPWQVLSRGDV